MMDKNKLLISLGILLAILIYITAFTVDEREQVVILQFGNPVRVVKSPGLNFKLPFPFQSLVVFEDRLLEYDSAPTEILTLDKKALVVDNFARWRVDDPTLFLQAVNSENEAQSRLDDIVYSELRVELGKYNLIEIVAAKRDTIMEEVTRRCDEIASQYGIGIRDVRIKRADLPEENEIAVFGRMRAERERQAKQYRSEGEEEALKIRSETDKERAIILAEAYRIGEASRGEGDAEALRIYAEAFQQDPAFFEFNRTLEAYKATLDENTTVVLTPETDFFQVLKRGQ